MGVFVVNGDRDLYIYIYIDVCLSRCAFNLDFDR